MPNFVQESIHHWKVLLKDKAYLYSLLIGFAVLIGAYIVNHFTNAGLSSKRSVEVQEHYVRVSRASKEKVLTYNIIATLPGNDDILKDEYVIIGGHYDSTKNPVFLHFSGFFTI